MEVQSIRQAQRELEDIIFREVDARWVHHPHADALVIMTQVTNNNVHHLTVDDGSTIDILYLNAYKRMSLTEDDLDPNSFPLWGFT